MSDLFTPITLFFGIVAIGWMIGKIRILGISLGASAVLLTAMLAGVACKHLLPDALTADSIRAFSDLSSLGTLLFASAVGLHTGLTVRTGEKKAAALSLLFGAFTVTVGFLTAVLLSHIDHGTNVPLLAGLFCGAMTSSPALASACEGSIHASLTTLGYGIAYPIGVTLTVLWVQLLLWHSDAIKAQPCAEKTPDAKDDFILPLLAASAFLGALVGRIRFGGFSIGGAGGALLLSMLVGICFRRFKKAIPQEFPTLHSYRTLGLLLFFVGNGITASQKIGVGIEVRHLFYSIALTLVPLAIATLGARLIFRKSKEETAPLLAGGMTSTPALGCILERRGGTKELPLYSLAYVGALLTAVLLSRLL